MRHFLKIAGIACTLVAVSVEILISLLVAVINIVDQGNGLAIIVGLAAGIMGLVVLLVIIDDIEYMSYRFKDPEDSYE